MLLYFCDELSSTDLESGGDCDGSVSNAVAQCRGGALLAAWAVGAIVSSSLWFSIVSGSARCMCTRNYPKHSKQQSGSERFCTYEIIIILLLCSSVLTVKLDA